MNFEQNKLTQFGSVLLACLFLNGCGFKDRLSEQTMLEAPKQNPIRYENLEAFNKKNNIVCSTHNLPKICQEVRLDLYRYYSVEKSEVERLRSLGETNLCWLVQKHYKDQSICDQIKILRQQDSHRKDVILEVLNESIKALEDGKLIPNDEGKLDNSGIGTFSPTQIPPQK